MKERNLFREFQVRTDLQISGQNRIFKYLSWCDFIKMNASVIVII